MLSKKFTRNIEDFTCSKCGAENKGNGYTNHCFNCLYSKHVDINPGDRQELCQGLMAPIEVITKKNNYVIIHKCEKCGLVKKNKSNPNDNILGFFTVG